MKTPAIITSLAAALLASCQPLTVASNPLDRIEMPAITPGPRMPSAATPQSLPFGFDPHFQPIISAPSLP